MLIEQSEPPAAGLVRHYFASQERGDSTYLVACVNGVPAGTGEIALTGRVELRNLHVDEEFRERGVGAAIGADGVTRAATETDEYLTKMLDELRD